MKKFVLFFGCFLMAAMINAQVPQGFKYQTVARNNAGEILASQNISFRMTILQGALPGTVAYAETHSATTNASGLATLEIGRGTPVTGDFAAINWSTTPIFLKTEIDPAGGAAYVEMGTSELLSVPYALFAENTANNEDADADPTNELQTISKDGQTVTLSIGGGSFTDEVNDADANPTNEIQTLSQNGLNVTLTQGGGTINVADNDNNPANELQQISKEGNTVALSQGGGSFTDENTTYQAGAGLELTGITFSNTAPDQTVSITPGTGISKSGTYPNFTISNSMPDQTVSIVPGTGITKSGTYPNFTIANSMPDQTVAMQATGDATISGTYPNFTIHTDPTNELQTVTENNYQVTLSEGGGSFMTGVKSFSQAEIDVMTPYNGLTVINTTTNCVNYYVINNWFEACGTCTPQPTQAAAGNDQNFTDNTTSANLAGNAPTFGTGIWTVQTGGGGSFDDATNPAATFTGQACTSYSLTWSITNTCGTSTDLLNIVFNNTPSVPDAGPDQIGIGGSTTTLAANTPADGTGLWTVVTGEGGSFGDPTSPVSEFTGVLTTAYTLSWTISTPCASLSDEMNISFWVCGDPLIIDHLVSGSVAPVDKSVTYGTITNIPGETSKCWITSNLGADHQPTNVSDATVASAGWYWQFNRKQGYKHDGGTRTPNTAWVSSISETSDWTPANDPCTLELGAGWRIPTNTEWTAVDASGNWTNWNGPWNSGLKMHAAGSIESGNGGLGWVGIYGFYWSNSQYSATNGFNLNFSSSSSGMINKSKAMGFSLRCLKD
jgi:hypothetical protein